MLPARYPPPPPLEVVWSSGYSPYTLHVELTKGPLPLSLLPHARSKGGREEEEGEEEGPGGIEAALPW